MPRTAAQNDSRYPVELHRLIDKTKTQPDLTTPEGQALWTLFIYIATNDEGGIADDGEGPSAADTCQVLYEILGKFGLDIP